MGEVRVHARRSARRRPPAPRGTRRCRRAPAPPCARGAAPRRRRARRRGGRRCSPVPSGELSSTISTRPDVGQPLADRPDEALDVLGLVVGGEHHPDGFGHGAKITSGDAQRRDRRRPAGAGHPLRARRRRPLPRARLQGRRQGRRRQPRVARAALGGGTADRAAGLRQDARGQGGGADRDRQHPRGRQAEGEVPRLPGRGDAGPGARRQEDPPPLRRARRHGPGEPARRRRAGADQGDEGLRRQGRGAGARGARDAARTRGTSPSGGCSRRSCRSPRSWPRCWRGCPRPAAWPWRARCAGGARPARTST